MLLAAPAMSGVDSARGPAGEAGGRETAGRAMVMEASLSPNDGELSRKPRTSYRAALFRIVQ
jgi:hypothetical protein